MARYLIVRHAEPLLRGVLLGQCDPGLSPAGEAQAAALAGRIPPYRSLVASPLRRAHATARALGSEILLLEGLREWSYGAWDGKSWAEIEALYPEEARWRLADWFRFTAPGQESWTAFRARVEEAWGHIEKMPPPVCVVGHEAVNSVLWQILRGEDPHRFRQQYCEILEA